MSRKNWLEILDEIQGLVGKREALRLMVLAKISPITADKMLRRSYPSVPRLKTLHKLELILEKVRK